MGGSWVRATANAVLVVCLAVGCGGDRTFGEELRTGVTTPPESPAVDEQIQPGNAREPEAVVPTVTTAKFVRPPLVTTVPPSTVPSPPPPADVPPEPVVEAVTTTSAGVTSTSTTTSPSSSTTSGPVSTTTTTTTTKTDPLQPGGVAP